MADVDPDTNGRRETRLELRTMCPAPAASLDGAWWPRSRDSIGELVALIDALDARQAPVRLLMLNPDDWRGHPHRIEVADRSVRIAWVAMLDRSVVIGATAGGLRIDLQLMVPAAGGVAGR
ncbi:hypothetical protein Dvina_20180 [Dactylosporangium vinaceum]|uniref:DUF5994 family protein n=1 Tax=Dactylosporangium vinaceum TaxID=53362 RepID=A0ABV5MSF3_9ACTN|nr:DUF5994 family protein [Dactylosporangium vinaceum]UAC00170.1 hypothetical protein Dvina_20180 [Dactylosporangium vinaceum]